MLQPLRAISIACLLISAITFTGCNTYAGKGAAEGAATGAISGAVGGMFTSLIFGGDVMEGAARGAVWGGAVGGTAGAISGSQVDKQIEQQQAAEYAALKAKIGNDAYAGLSALADCDYKTSLDKAADAQRSSNSDFALAGNWLEVLSYADKRDEQQARSLFPAIIETDNKIKTAAQAEDTMRKALNSLMDIREEYKKPRVCSA
jgi:predicted small secreted protein